MLFATTILSAQYNKMTFEGGWGTSTIADENALLENDFSHYNATITYSFTNKFGLGIYVGQDNLNFIEGQDIDYQRVSLEAVLNGMNLFDFHNRTLNILAHGGIGMSRLNTSEGLYRNENMGVVTGGLTLVARISDPINLKLDYSLSGNFGQERTLDGRLPITNEQFNSLVNNFSVGLIWNIGRDKEHINWKKNPKVVDTVYVFNELQPVIIDRTVTNNIYEDRKVKKESVYFDYDSDVFTDGTQALDNIDRAADRLTGNTKIYLYGYASPENGTGNPNYNNELAQRRLDKVVSYLISTGVMKSQIVDKVVGGVDTSDSKNIDLNRKVVLLVK